MISFVLSSVFETFGKFYLIIFGLTSFVKETSLIRDSMLDFMSRNFFTCNESALIRSTAV